MSIKKVTNIISIIGILFLVFVLNGSDSKKQSGTSIEQNQKINNQEIKNQNHVFDYEVVRVVDGDTVVVQKKEDDGARSAPSSHIKVRLIGVNTPETVDPRKPVECFGKEASAYTRTILQGHDIALAYDPTQQRIDTYGRTLAYIYRDDGVFINLDLIQNGFAYEYTYKYPYQFQSQFKEAQNSAKKQQKGLWKTGVCDL